MHVDLTLKVVTPAFLGSYRPDCVEARTAPIRGALRYWLRALVGGRIGTQDIQNLRRVEESIFGSTRGNSPVTVRLVETSGMGRSNSYLLPHRQQGERQAFTGGNLKVRLASRPLTDSTVLETALWAALVWMNLGGLGCRSRRGAGSLRLGFVDTSHAQGLSNDLVQTMSVSAGMQQNGQDLAEHVGHIVAAARHAVIGCRNGRVATPEAAYEFPVLMPDSPMLVWCPQVQTPLDAVTALMNKMSATKASLGGNGFADVFGGIRPRHASPLHATVHETKAGPAVVMSYLMGPDATVMQLFNDLAGSYRVSPDGGRT